MVTEIKAAASVPGHRQAQSIGKSYQGRDLWVAKVSDNVAVDENEPEVMFDALHHAREHLSLEQNLALLRWLTQGYGSDCPDHEDREHARDLDRLRGQSRRRRVRHHRHALPVLAQEPPAERGDDRHRHGHQPQLRLSLGVLRRRRPRRRPRRTTARRVLDARGARDPRLHGQPTGQRPQQIRTAITFHTAGEQILWPYGYTKTRCPVRHDQRRPRRARRPRPADGRHERLHADAVEQPVRHRR